MRDAGRGGGEHAPGSYRRNRAPAGSPRQTRGCSGRPIEEAPRAWLNAGQDRAARRSSSSCDARREGRCRCGELMQRARLHPGERTDVKRALRDLAHEGRLAPRRQALRRCRGGDARPGAAAGARSRPAPRGAGPRRRSARASSARSRSTATASASSRGSTARGDDVFVPPDEAAKALDGDLVRVEVVPGARRADRRADPRGGGAAAAPPRRHLPRPRPAELRRPRRPRARRATSRCRRRRVAEDGDVVKVALDPGRGAPRRQRSSRRSAARASRASRC